LVVISPQGLDDKARFAIDQFLMRGGSVVIAAGNYQIAFDQFLGNLSLQPVDGGLNEMLAHYGITVEKALVMDTQNEPFPVQTERQVGGIVVREIQAINYPFFVDVRASGMDKTSPIVSKLPAITLNWVSPLTVDESKNQGREVKTLLTSSAKSWLRNDINIQPNLNQYPGLGFPVEGEQKARPLAVSVRGSFESYFKGKPSPLAQQQPQAEAQGSATPTPAPQTAGVIEASPDTARLVVVGSNDFLTDVVFQISASLTPDRYLNSLQFLQNAVDWSVEDLDLLGIRSRGQSARVLEPLSEAEQRTWEVLNYVVALAAVIGIGVISYLWRRNERPLALVPQAK
ncbi:MAG: GldG family protein, partial [Anaerolineae bacterium]|nr:GldG family protein [Anaerolineae bacterium]